MKNNLQKAALLCFALANCIVRMASASAIDPWHDQSKPFSDVELSRALLLLGFGSWPSLQAGNYQINNNVFSLYK